MSSQQQATNESRLWTKHFVTDFINLYRKQPCLWNQFTKEYKSVPLRNRAYDKLVAFCRPIFPNADREFVAKKIHNLRGTFRKEHNKVMREQRANGKPYVPSLWYYNLLLFTVNVGSPRNPNRAKFSPKVTPLKLKQEPPDYSEESQDDDTAEEMDEDDQEEPHSTSSRQRLQSVLGDTNENKRKGSMMEAVNEGAMLECPCKRHEVDEFEATGINVSQKLRRMDAFQAICAEFLINSILKRGLLKTLLPSTTLCDNQCGMH